MKRLNGILKSLARGWQGYPLAVVLVGLATWLKYLAQPDIIPTDVPILYLVAIVPIAVFFGLGPSILCCILSVFAYDFYFVADTLSRSFLDVVNAPIIVIFLGVGILFSLLSSNLRTKNLIALKEIAARKQVEAELIEHQAQLENKVQQRTAELEKANLDLKEDITERQIAEEALMKAREQAEIDRKRLEVILETVPAAVVLIEASTMSFSYINRRAMSLYGMDYHGYQLDSHVAKVRALKPDGTVYPVEDMPLTHSLKYGESFHNQEMSIERADGTRIPVMASTAPILDAKGKVTAAIAVFDDITDRKKAEEELQKMEKLESIGHLAGGIAHDFNNLLTAILGNISLARMQVAESSQLFSTLEDAEKASLRARELTQQLLTFSRGGAPVKKLISMADLIIESTAFALRGSTVKPEYSIKPELWAVEADEGQIQQVLHNLVKNAVEAMPEGGVVRITALNAIIPEASNIPLAPGKYVHVAVTDSGTGIKKEHLGRMFEPFFTTKPKGSGLGLATSYSIIKNHGGYIGVDSGEGVGTTFDLFLPASDIQVSRIKAEIPRHTTMGEGKILVMDDEAMIRSMLGNILAHAGYQIVLANDGAEAVKEFVKAKESGAPFDAVIMDLTVPGGMGGKEAIKQLLEIDPGVKAVVSSGYANDPIMADYQKFGFKAVVTKPYTAEKIEITLDSLLKRKKSPG